MSSDFFGDFNESGHKRGNIGPGTNSHAQAHVTGGADQYPQALLQQRRRQAEVAAESRWLSLSQASEMVGLNPRVLEEHARAGRLLAAFDERDPAQKIRISASSLRANRTALRHRQVSD